VSRQTARFQIGKPPGNNSVAKTAATYSQV